MKFTLSRASDSTYLGNGGSVEIDSLEQLRELCIKEGYELIVDLRPGRESIMVYDNYVE